MQFDWQPLLKDPLVTALIELALQEDIGDGDATTEAIFGEPCSGRARIVCKSDSVVAGVPLAAAVLKRLGPELRITPLCEEGAEVTAATAICEVEGDVRAILTGERCALNFLMRLSGIATAARQAVRAVPDGVRAKIYDTRKTTPGWRRLDKAAVRIGGAENHRFGLFDGILIKDNHIAAAGSLGEAIGRARKWSAGRLPVEVEVDTLAQLEEALACAPDIVLLDNFSPAEMQEAVRRVAARGAQVELEASGGITVERIAEVAQTGVDRISLGALTHTVRPADMSLEWLS